MKLSCEPNVWHWLGHHTPKLELQCESEQLQFSGEIIENIKMKQPLGKKKKKVSECFILQKLLYFCLYPVVYFLRWKLSFSSALIPRYLLTMNKLKKIKLKQRIFCIKMSCLYQLHQNACPSFFFEFVLLLFWITLNLPSLQRLTHLLWNDSIPKETI